MKFILANTYLDWFNYLARLQPEDVNYWQPGGNVAFRAISRGLPFLFRLKSPINRIA